MCQVTETGLSLALRWGASAATVTDGPGSWDVMTDWRMHVAACVALSHALLQQGHANLVAVGCHRGAEPVGAVQLAGEGQGR